MRSIYNKQELAQFPEERTLVDTTNVLASTYYPSAAGESVGEFKDISLTGKLITATNTNSIWLEATNDEDTTGADWVQVYGYDAKNNVMVNSISAASTTATFAIDFDNLNYRYFRIRLLVADAVNTTIIKLRKKTP